MTIAKSKQDESRPGAEIRNWKHLERLVTALLAKLDDGAKVEGNVKLLGASGPRQIDTIVRGTLSGVSVLVIINSKNLGRRVDVNDVGALADVMADVNASRGIVVSSKGFSKQALKRAALSRIDTCLVRPAVDDDWKGRLRSTFLSVVARSVVIDSVELEFEDGERQSVLPLAMVENEKGEQEFIDQILASQLEATNTWNEGVMHVYEVTREFFYAPDEAARRKIRFFRASAHWVDAFKVEHEFRAKEDWAYVKLTPEGAGDETMLFSFAEIDSLVHIETTMRNAAAEVRCPIHGGRPINIRLEWLGTQRTGLSADQECCSKLGEVMMPAVERALANIGVSVAKIHVRPQPHDPLPRVVPKPKRPKR